MSRLLLVDDSTFDTRFASGLLKQETKWIVDTAANGRDAIEKLDRDTYDVVVSDLIMPEVDGLELLQTVRRRFPSIPVVIMTSQGSEEIAVRALQQGAASYLSKKNLKRDLERVVHSVLMASSRDRAQSRLLAHLTLGEFTFSIPNDADLLFSAIRFLQDAADQLCILDDPGWTRLGIALEEAISNAMIHGNLEVGSELRDSEEGAYDRLIAVRKQKPPYRDRKVHITARFQNDELTFVIRDEGPGFDPSTLPDPRKDENLLNSHGRGLFLIHRFMDEVTYSQKGNEITLTKRRRLNDDSELYDELEAALP